MAKKKKMSTGTKVAIGAGALIGAYYLYMSIMFNGAKETKQGIVNAINPMTYLKKDSPPPTGVA